MLARPRAYSLIKTVNILDAALRKKVKIKNISIEDYAKDLLSRETLALMGKETY